MQIFKCFFQIVNKNKISLCINIGVFVALMMMFTAMSGSELKMDYSETAVNIAVMDRDGSELSAALTGFLDQRHDIKDIPDDAEKLQDALFYRDVEYILTIPEGFEDAFLSDGGAKLSNVKLPGSSTGVYVDHQIDRFLATVRAYLSVNFSLTDSLSHAADDLRLSTTVEINGDQPLETPATYYYFSYLVYILVALIIAALGPVLIAFHQRDLRQRMDSSSFTLRSRNAQTALGCITVSLGLWVLFMIAALVSYRGDMFTVISALQVINSLALLAVCISIAFLMGQLLGNAAALGAVNNAVTLGMSFICGVFVPQQYLGETVLTIAKFLPAYWYIRSNDMLSAMGTPDIRIYNEGLLIQFGFAVAIFAVALVISRQKRNHPTVM